MAEEARRWIYIRSEPYNGSYTFSFGGFESVYALNGNLVSLEVNSDDFSELTVTLKNGIVASIHTDMFGRDHKKELEIKGESGNIY